MASNKGGAFAVELLALEEQYMQVEKETHKLEKEIENSRKRKLRLDAEVRFLREKLRSFKKNGDVDRNFGVARPAVSGNLSDETDDEQDSRMDSPASAPAMSPNTRAMYLAGHFHEVNVTLANIRTLENGSYRASPIRIQSSAEYESDSSLQDRIQVFLGCVLVDNRAFVSWGLWREKTPEARPNSTEMINAVLVMNTQGKPRITKFYEPLKAVEKQQDIIRTVYSVLSCRGENFCSFVEADDIFGPSTKIVYKHFATLYFVFVIDQAESELAILDLIQVFVETLDRNFKNVCELDIIYNFNKREMAGLIAEQQFHPTHMRTTPVSLARETTGAEKSPVVSSMNNKGKGQENLVSEETNISEGAELEEVGAQLGRIELSVARSPSISRSRAEYTAANSPILFSFGVITDVQYADIPDGFSYGGTPRFYRHAVEVQRRAVNHWNNHGKLSFAVHFGDLVDGKCPKEESAGAVSRILEIFNSFQGGPVYQMIGNHCLYNLPRPELNRVFKIPPSVDGRSYYEFSPYAGFRFVVLDGYDISVLGWHHDHPHVQLALHMLNSVNPNVDKNSPLGLDGLMARFVMFNGGVGREQLMWLDRVLLKATSLNEKVVICSHLPLHPDCAPPTCLCWNFDEVLAVLHSYNCVVACFSGHAHSGGYCQDVHSVHHVVLEAALECPPGTNAFGHVAVFPDRLSLRGVHTILDEIIMGGQVVETNSAEIMKAIQEINTLEKASEPVPTIVKNTFRRPECDCRVFQGLQVNMGYRYRREECSLACNNYHFGIIEAAAE
ncbi:hypothetical protein R1sor_019914 [Riccia sorocarpa]|uniref:AP complex mu/sigma subunit domain-containing protein n=1 Tax=Riccia sorocarpa TaxID=122646 RepID=A0ABD3II87_9MARC